MLCTIVLYYSVAWYFKDWSCEFFCKIEEPSISLAIEFFVLIFRLAMSYIQLTVKTNLIRSVLFNIIYTW